MAQLRNLTHDFVRRTLANLRAIERLARTEPDKHFEITQLINSCIGLLFVPTEDQIERLMAESISGFLGEVEPPRLLYGQLPYENAAGLVRYLRNAFAHLNFDFEYQNNLIEGVYVWNEDEREGVKWVAYVRQDDLRNLLNRLAKSYLDVIAVTERNSSKLARVERLTGRSLRLTNPSGK